MKLLDFLPYNCVIEQLSSDAKEDVLEELTDAICAADSTLNAGKILHVLKEREKIGTTGIGNHIAIPHGKLHGLSSLHAAFGRSTSGVNFDAIDHQPVNFIVMLLAPEESIGDHLKALARISRLFKQEDFRDKLMKAQTKEEIWATLESVDDQSS